MSDRHNSREWRLTLHPGDEITWNDPDGGLCTKTGILINVKYHNGGVVELT